MTKTPKPEVPTPKCRHLLICNCDKSGFLSALRDKELSKDGDKKVVHNDTKDKPSRGV
jgi:hypothetical protein